MNIVLLSGGSGKRLWPLSNESRSKQFLRIFKTDNGYQSMIQRVFRQIRMVDPEANITIATSKSQVSAIERQIGKADLSIEPCRRDTFPAIALAAAFLHDVKGIDENDVAVVCPVDQYVDDSYFETLKELAAEASKGDAGLVLIGIRPDCPSTKYGYIIPESQDHVAKVTCFREKPDEATAKEYLKQGALWNGGVFAFKLKYVLDIARTTLGTSDYRELLNRYENLPKISFDYAVVEKETNIKTVRYSGRWMDLGTWNALSEVIEDQVIGNGLLDDNSNNTTLINELQIPVVSIGIRNAVIVSSADGILVADKAKSTEIKRFVDKIESRPMFEERFWGSYRVLEDRTLTNGMQILTKHLIILPGKKISYQKHLHRKEIWTIAGGTGKVLLDGTVSDVSAGSVITVEPGMLHSIKANAELHVIEVQMGDVLSEEDIERFPYEW